MLKAESAFVERFVAQIIHPETGWGVAWAQFHERPTEADQTHEQ